MMRNTFGIGLLCVAWMGCAIGAVGDGSDVGDPGGDPPELRPDAGRQPDPEPTPDPELADSDGDGIDDASDNCPDLANVNQLDGDNDTYGDACDCDPADSTVAAYLVANDSLDADRGLFAAASGFAADSWSYFGGGLRQSNLANDAEDAVLFTRVADLNDVLVDVRVASTAITNFDNNDLRQLFVLVGAQSSPQAFSSYACGIEVVEGLAPTQKTTAATLGGTPTQVETSAVQRVDRSLVVENEELDLRLSLENGVLTCTTVLDGNEVTEARAINVPPGQGVVGFYTRETRALFKDVRICSRR